MEKTLWRHWNTPSCSIDPMGKALFYERFFFKVAMIMVKDKLRIKHEVNKSNVTNSFREIWNEIDKRLILEKKFLQGRGDCSPPKSPRFLQAYIIIWPV